MQNIRNIAIIAQVDVARLTAFAVAQASSSVPARSSETHGF